MTHEQKMNIYLVCGRCCLPAQIRWDYSCESPSPGHVLRSGYSLAPDMAQGCTSDWRSGTICVSIRIIPDRRPGRSAVAPREARKLLVRQSGAPADSSQQRSQGGPPFWQDCFRQDGTHLGLSAAASQSRPHTQGAMHLVGQVVHGQHGHNRSPFMPSMHANYQYEVYPTSACMPLPRTTERAWVRRPRNDGQR